MPKTASSLEPTSIVAVERFIQATRDSGYKSTVSAVSELVDNSLQAGAGLVVVFVLETRDPDFPLEVAVLDDGEGMTRSALQQAMRFGGSSRFGDRSGLGRYGMGLPNASLSQARRVEVSTWRGGRPLYSYLDVDEIAAGDLSAVPAPSACAIPEEFRGLAGETGTLVRWLRCDRLDNRRVSTIERKLLVALGRVFRHFLWQGVTVMVNTRRVEPVDPLYLATPSAVTGGAPYGPPRELQLRCPGGGVSTVTVTFSELPVRDWHHLSNLEKRRLGVSDGAGVSVVRAGREVEYGWHFMGKKRRENYDDWWRCEVRFEPELDELFGITHTKQQVRPAPELLEALVPELEETARVLNARARRAYQDTKRRTDVAGAEAIAASRERALPPLPRPSRGQQDHAEVARLASRFPVLAGAPAAPSGLEYRLVEDAGAEGGMYQLLREEGRLTVVLNPQHRFYHEVYKPLSEAGGEGGARSLQLLLLAAARAEATARTAADRRAVAAFRDAWGHALEVLLKPGGR